MATIYRAQDAQTGEAVALKVLHEKEGRQTERFNQEAALLAELRHPAIVRYVDHGVTPAGEHYLAMEWLEGETLEDRLMSGPVGIIETARLARRVLEAVDVAHRKGIIHRDLKPSNLFLPDGDLAQVKVLDFGIARRMFDSKRITVTGSTLGTPMYMSPEQARGAAHLDARSDIFSLGCVLFECLTGQPPFTGENPVAVLAKICLDALDVKGRCPMAPAPLIALLERMLVKDAAQRPADAAAFATEVQELIDQLIAAGYGKTARDNLMPHRTPTPVLTGGEQRVLSAILVSRPRALTPVSSPEDEEFDTWDVPAAVDGEGRIDVFDERGFAEVTKVLEPFGARVDRFLGGSMVITLLGRGTPTDQVSEAARCALRLKALLPRAAFAVSTVRTETDRDLPMGQVIDWAARLLAGERPGSISLDQSAAGLLEARFEIRGHEKKYLLFEKGLNEAPRTVLGRELPCVGRDREIRTLEALFLECIGEPTARAVMVTSPPGGGKSRVRLEFLDRIQQRGERFEFLLGRGDSVGAGSPFGLIGPALRAAAGISGGEPLAVQQRRLLGRVGRHLRPEVAKRVAAFLGEVAGIHFPDDYLPALAAARQDPPLMADQTLTAWLDWLEAECAVRPVLMVLEDVHWGDIPSVQLVDAALRLLRDKRFMVLALARPEVDEKFPGLWAERDVQRISLPPLTSKACQKLAQMALGNLSAEKAAWIVGRADGNPFFLEELLRAVAGGADLKRTMPETVIGMVQARFDTLGRDARRVLRAASVFGETFRAAGVKALVGDGDTDVDQWLDILTTREVLFRRPVAQVREFVFRHALMRDAAYEMLTAEDRVLGHRLAGEFLEKGGHGEAMLLVEHFERGGVLPKAAHFSHLAAAQALDANDLSAVIERVARGVRCGAEGESLGSLRLLEAQARFWRGEYADAETAAKQSMALVKETVPRLQGLAELVAAVGQQARYDEVERLAAQVQQLSPEASQKPAYLALLLRAAGYLLPGGRYELAEQILGILERREADLGPALRARLENLRGSLAAHQGQQARALATLQTAWQAFEALGDVRHAAEILVNVGTTLGELGLLEEAEEKLGGALVTADRFDLRFVTAAVLSNLAQVRMHLGQWDDARATAEKAKGLARRQGDRRFEGAAELYLALTAHSLGQLPESTSHARAAVDLLRSVAPIFPAAVAALARALLAQGYCREALEQAIEANRLADEAGRIEDCEGLVRLSLVECLLASGKEEAARKALDLAVSRLKERAAAIEKTEWRTAFLTRLPDHARTIELARHYGLASH